MHPEERQGFFDAGQEAGAKRPFGIRLRREMQRCVARRVTPPCAKTTAARAQECFGLEQPFAPASRSKSRRNLFFGTYGSESAVRTTGMALSISLLKKTLFFRDCALRYGRISGNAGCPTATATGISHPGPFSEPVQDHTTASAMPMVNAMLSAFLVTVNFRPNARRFSERITMPAIASAIETRRPVRIPAPARTSAPTNGKAANAGIRAIVPNATERNRRPGQRSTAGQADDALRCQNRQSRPDPECDGENGAHHASSNGKAAVRFFRLPQSPEISLRGGRRSGLQCKRQPAINRLPKNDGNAVPGFGPGK